MSLRVTMSVAAMGLAGLIASPASATPTAGFGVLKSATTVDTSATKVHWRRYRHCHWRHGRRHCHGRRHYRGYYGVPGINLYFGSRHHRRHHGRHHRRHRD